jgi:hypothetical protein
MIAVNATNRSFIHDLRKLDEVDPAYRENSASDMYSVRISTLAPSILAQFFVPFLSSYKELFGYIRNHVMIPSFHIHYSSSFTIIQSLDAIWVELPTA